MHVNVNGSYYEWIPMLCTLLFKFVVFWRGVGWQYVVTYNVVLLNNS